MSSPMETTEASAWLAQGSLIAMALVPILVGAFGSVKSHKEQLTSTGEVPTSRMTQTEAAMTPLVYSCGLFGLYILLKVFPKEQISLLLSVGITVIDLNNLAHMISPFMDTSHYPLVAWVVPLFYLTQKHWMANNLMVMAMAIISIEQDHLNNVKTGCIMMGGLFFYDIFWVFATDVMTTVVMSLDAPMKLVFPKDLLENGLGAKNMAMLGLGDIVFPGMFVALMLRYDYSLKRGTHFYFWTTFLAYICGLVVTFVARNLWKHSQPALLYLVPACLGAPTLMAAISGDLSSMFSYADYPEG